MRGIVFAVFSFAARALAKLSRISSLLGSRFAPADLQRRNIVASTRYDMAAAPDESYYAEQYWRAMLPHLNGLPSNGQALDLGCGQGRFSIRLARLLDGGDVVGCDLSEAAIALARDYAARVAARNVDFRAQSISDCLERLQGRCFDVILLTEVTFFHPDWERELPAIVSALRPGGLLMVSFRSQYFDALCSLDGGHWSDLGSIRNSRRGALFGGGTVFTWQTSAEIKALLVEEYGLDLLELRGIGVCSGIPGDPHHHICQPSRLSDSERSQLMALELDLGKTVPDGGRYIFAVARKPEAQVEAR